MELTVFGQIISKLLRVFRNNAEEETEMPKHKKLPKKAIIKHLKGDMQMFDKEHEEDEALIKKLGGKPADKKEKKDSPKAKKDPKPKPRTKMAKKAKVEKVMREFKSGKLHSGSKKGPVVTNPKQALAISLSEAGVAKKRKRKKK